MPRDQTYFGASEFPYLEMGRSLSGSAEVREVAGDCGYRRACVTCLLFFFFWSSLRP